MLARPIRRTWAPGLVLLGLLLTACASTGNAVSTGVRASGGPASGTPAPSFSLTDQFGHPEELSDLRGRDVLLTFIDSHCTTLCPLTAELMTRTERALHSQVPIELVAINANPTFTSVSAVRRWSIRHDMLRRWLFLTGPVEDLRAVWNEYGIQAKVVQGDVVHTAVIFLIDSAGSIRGYFPIAQHRGIDAEASSIAQAIRAVGATET